MGQTIEQIEIIKTFEEFSKQFGEFVETVRKVVPYLPPDTPTEVLLDLVKSADDCNRTLRALAVAVQKGTQFDGNVFY